MCCVFSSRLMSLEHDNHTKHNYQDHETHSHCYFDWEILVSQLPGLLTQGNVTILHTQLVIIAFVC